MEAGGAGETGGGGAGRWQYAGQRHQGSALSKQRDNCTGLMTGDVLVVLAGGKSTRFGQSKLRVKINGEPILQWQQRRLGQTCSGICWLSVCQGFLGRGENGGHDRNSNMQYAGSMGYQRIIQDADLRSGPMGGMLATLLQMRDDAAAVMLPADMPLVSPWYVHQLVRQLRSRPGLAAVMGQHELGSVINIEPFPSAWRGGPRGEGTTLLKQMLAADIKSPSQAGGRGKAVGYLSIGTSPTHRQMWMNINRPADMQKIENLLGVPVGLS